jgi:hypothetical protein
LAVIYFEWCASNDQKIIMPWRLVDGPERSCFMTEPLPILIENSLQIAWDYLEGIGELADQQQTAEFLLRNIQSQMLKGERRTLMLSNRAIESYRKQPNHLQLVRWG